MTVPSTPENLKESAAAYVLGDLDPEEAEEFKQLLAENPELVAEVNGLQDVLGQVLNALTEAEPPQHLRAAILEAANIPANRTPRAKRSRFPWREIAGSVAALLVVVLGLDNYRLRQDLSIVKNITTMLQHSETRLFSLKGVDKADTASGNIVMDLEQRKIVIFIQNLPAPPVGRVYRLWAVVDKDKIPCGELNASQQLMVLDKISIPIDLYEGISGLIVTLEPSIANPDPVGPVVMRSLS